MTRRGAKATMGAGLAAGKESSGPGAAAPPRSVVDRYASVFESKKQKRARETAEGLVEDFARCAEQQSCPHCELIGEAHLHGSMLYEAGRALF